MRARVTAAVLMVILDRESGAEWVDAISAAKQAGDWAETSSMESANEPRARAEQKTAHELLML